MINKERKQLFVEEHSDNQVGERSKNILFRIFDKYEDEWGIDLCEQTIDKVQPVIDEITTSSFMSIQDKLWFLRIYVEWCKEKGYKTSDAYKQIVINADNGIMKELYGSPEELKETMDNIFGDPWITFTNPYRTFLWFAYIGIPLNEVAEITSDEFSIQKQTITHNGKTYYVCKEALSDLANARTCTEFVYSLSNPVRYYIKERAGGNKMLRGIKSEDVSIRVLEKYINRQTSCYEHKQVTYNKTFKSGYFFRCRNKILEREILTKSDLEQYFLNILRPSFIQ